MTAHVCSTECKCGHWRSGRRVDLPQAGRRRGGWNLDILDDAPDNLDYSGYEQENEDEQD